MKYIVAGESNVNEADGWSTFLKCWLLTRGPVHNPQNKIILSNLEAACIIGLQHSALKLAIFSGLSSLLCFDPCFPLEGCAPSNLSSCTECPILEMKEI